ncbi:MAG TPA: hypothetical protein VKY44_07320, partial [Flavobacterium sp.]|nr:hypothetical protein [Flavobacterium sp.]
MKLKLHTTNIVFFIVASVLMTSCATYNEQTGKGFLTHRIDNAHQHTLLHEVVVVGDAGNADEPQGKKLLQTVEDYLKSGTQNQTLLFIGDNIYPLGMPKENSKHRQLAEEKIDAQIDLAQYVNGATIFL